MSSIGLIMFNLLGCNLLQTPPGTAELASSLPERFVYGAAVGDAGRAPPATFWMRFRSPELAALIITAEQGSQDIAAAIARVGQAQALAEQAATLLWPTGNAQWTSTEFRLSGSAAGLSAPLPPRTLHQFVFNAAYELDFWGKNAATLRSAEHAALASSYDLDAVRLSVTAAAALTYLNVLSARDQLRLVGQNVQISEKVEANVRLRVDAGAATQSDLAQQHTVVLQQRSAIPALRRAAEQSEIALAVLLGVPPGAVRVRAGGLAALSIPALASGIPTELLRRRPDLRRAEEQLLAAAESVTQAKAAMLPSITLTPQYGYQSPLLQTLFLPQSNIYQVIGGITQPLFDAVRLAAVLKQNDQRREELVAGYRKAILSSLGDVESALVALRTTAREEAILRAAAAEARRAYDLAAEQMAAGQVDINTLLNTQRTYFNAVTGVEQIRLTRFQAAIALYQALGGGWSADDQREARTAALRQDSCREADQCP
jgi:NodT family efflux transporter outer membrane factor (OMF) lipoprotein